MLQHCFTMKLQNCYVDYSFSANCSFIRLYLNIVCYCLKVRSAICSVVITTDWTIHSQGGVCLHVEGQQSSPQPLTSELFRLGDRQGAAASDRPEPASAESGDERLCLSHPPLPGGRVLELHAPPPPRPGALRVGGQPVPAQPGWPLRGAAVDRPHRLPPTQGRRHLLPGQEVLEVEVSIVGSQRQRHRWVGGGGGQELQGSGAAGPDRLPAGQEPVYQVHHVLFSSIIQLTFYHSHCHASCAPIHKILCMLCSQDSCRVLPEAAVPEGESLSQCDRVKPGSSTEAQCSDRCWAAFAEGSGTSSGRAGVRSLYQSADIAKGPSICPTRAHRYVIWAVYLLYELLTLLYPAMSVKYPNRPRTQP